MFGAFHFGSGYFAQGPFSLTITAVSNLTVIVRGRTTRVVVIPDPGIVDYPSVERIVRR